MTFSPGSLGLPLAKLGGMVIAQGSAATSSRAPAGHDSDVLLADGTTAHVRDIRPEDADALVAFHRRLSTESIVLRFFGPHPVLSDREVAHFTTVDGVDRVALVAERADRLLSIVRYDRTPGSDEAEVAFVVADDFQGKGLATILLEHLAVAARSNGIRRFVADTLADNHRMLAVLRGAGFARQYTRSAEVVRVVLDIAPSQEAVAAAQERDRQAVVASMARVLRPSSVAVVGASRRPGTIGHEVLRNLLQSGFQGPVYAVNPGATSVAGVPCWPDVASILGPVDLALVTVPAASVASVVEDCGRKGVGALVVITAGFAEAGAAGGGSQEQITHLAHSYGMRLVGPNCFGVVNTDPAVSMNATFSATAPVAGPVGFASQSGGLGIAILSEAAERGIGLSSFVSMGNKADVSSNDLLQWWEQDPATDVALLYLESFGNPRRFGRVAQRVSRTLPIVAVKSGRSPAGTRGARSHTAALASPEDAVDALFHRTGVLRVDTIEELFDVAEVLAGQPVPAGNRVAIVGNAGGPGVLAADACVGHGLEVPELSPGAQAALAAFLPDGAALSNPVDLIASSGAEAYAQALGVLLAGDEVDAVVTIFTPPLVTRAEDVAMAVRRATQEAAAAGTTKPVLASFIGAPEARTVLRQREPLGPEAGNGAEGRGQRPVPCFAYPETAVRALAHAVAHGAWLARPPGVEVVPAGTDANAARRLLEAQPPGTEWLTGATALELLATYGIPIAPSHGVSDAAGAEAAARSIGGPVAVKADGPGLLHKSEHGGVQLGLTTPEAARLAYEAMHGALGEAMTGAVVQAMAAPGVETIAGFVDHEAFGPVVLFGLGGTAVELLGDHVTRLAPLTDVEAAEMVHGLRAEALLTGFRGSEPVDLAALEDLLLRLGRLASDLPELVEADCNPVVATAQGAVVVDARIRVRHDLPVVDPRRRLR